MKKQQQQQQIPIQTEVDQSADLDYTSSMQFLKRVIVNQCTALQLYKTHKGLQTSDKSLTIPGQSLTPAEIMRAYASAPNRNPVQDSPELMKYMKMDIFEKNEYLRNLRQNNQAMMIRIQTELREKRQSDEYKQFVTKYENDNKINKHDVTEQHE